jgi:hypothetical protein
MKGSAGKPPGDAANRSTLSMVSNQPERRNDMIRTRAPRPPLAALLAVVALLGAPACAHVTLISPYDEATDQGVTALERSISGLLTQLDQNPVPAYSTVAATWDGVFSDLGSLRFRNEARPKNQQTIAQLEELRLGLEKLRQSHQQDKLVQPMLGPARESLEQTLRAILKLELAKKELVP